MPNKSLLSVLILTLNEAETLSISIGSVRRYMGDIDIVVLDSNSTDGTRDLAEALGARVIIREFDGYATQRNAGLEELSEYEWVLMLDADEEITEEFSRELLDFVSSAKDSVSMARFRRRDFFLGKWIKRSSGYPTWFGRLVRPTKVTVEREINEEYTTEGNIAELGAHINHYPFTKGIDHWVHKHNLYSSKEAVLVSTNHTRKFRVLDLLVRDPLIRRAALKAVYMRLPMRPFLGFIYLYVFRLGFLDGHAGLKFCTLRFVYETLIDLKVAEGRRYRQTK